MDFDRCVVVDYFVDSLVVADNLVVVGSLVDKMVGLVESQVVHQGSLVVILGSLLKLLDNLVVHLDSLVGLQGSLAVKAGIQVEMMEKLEILIVMDMMDHHVGMLVHHLRSLDH